MMPYWWAWLVGAVLLGGLALAYVIRKGYDQEQAELDRAWRDEYARWRAAGWLDDRNPDRHQAYTIREGMVQKVRILKQCEDKQYGCECDR